MSPNAGPGGVDGVSANEYSLCYEAQINYGDLTPYSTNSYALYNRYSEGPQGKFLLIPIWN